MNQLIIFSLLGFIIISGIMPFALAAQLDAKINPNSESSQFSIKYLKTSFSSVFREDN